MNAFETYVERGSFADPYTPVTQMAARIRIQTGRRGLGVYNLKYWTQAESRAKLTPRFQRGSLALITLIPKSNEDRSGRLADLLQTLETVRAKADPYTEIGERLQAVIAEIRKPAAKIPAERVQSLTLDDFLRPALQLERGGQIDPALDVLYDRVNDLLKSKEFSTMDSLLRQANVDALSTDILLGLLTASLPAKSKLPFRSRFFSDVEASVKRRGEWEDGLLTGLES